MKSDSQTQRPGKLLTSAIVALCAVYVLPVAVGAIHRTGSDAYIRQGPSAKAEVMQSQPDCTPTPSPTPHQE